MDGKLKISAGAIVLLAASTLNAAANEKITFGTNWLAQAE
ncbi:MAG: ABC transporter substrate-binding protein, partial [Mesorhizobium sp.]